MARTEVASKMYTNNHGYTDGPLSYLLGRSPANYFPPLVLYPLGGGNRSRSLRTNARVTPRKSGAMGRPGREHGRERKTRSVTQNDPREAEPSQAATATAVTVSPGAIAEREREERRRRRRRRRRQRRRACVHTRRP